MVLSLLPVVLALLSRSRPSVQRLVLSERPGIDHQRRVLGQTWIARHISLARLHSAREDHGRAIGQAHRAYETVSTPWDIVDDCHGHIPLCAPSGADQDMKAPRPAFDQSIGRGSRSSAPRSAAAPVGHGLDRRARSDCVSRTIGPWPSSRGQRPPPPPPPPARNSRRTGENWATNWATSRQTGYRDRPPHRRSRLRQGGELHTAPYRTRRSAAVAARNTGWHGWPAPFDPVPACLREPHPLNAGGRDPAGP